VANIVPFVGRHIEAYLQVYLGCQRQPAGGSPVASGRYGGNIV